MYEKLLFSKINIFFEKVLKMKTRYVKMYLTYAIICIKQEVLLC